jgi:hypothetical protein
MPTVMLDDPGSNPGVNHGCMCLAERTCLVLSNHVVYLQLGKKPVEMSVYLFITITSAPKMTPEMTENVGRIVPEDPSKTPNLPDCWKS